MAIRILVDGSKEHKTECSCGTVFTYTNEDIENFSEYEDQVICPICNKPIRWVKQTVYNEYVDKWKGIFGL